MSNRNTSGIIHHAYYNNEGAIGKDNMNKPYK